MAKKKAKAEAGVMTEAIAGVPHRKLVTVEGPEVPTFYVNNVTIDLSSFDVRLRLGQIQGGDEGELRVKDIAYLFMSHPHARALTKALNESVSRLAAMAGNTDKSDATKPH